MLEKSMNGLVRNSKGHWVATHMGQRVTFTEQRFGEAAAVLARRVLLAMQAGTYDELRDNTLLKQSYSRELAAKGVVNGMVAPTQNGI
ncbi:MAG: hypothetical protein ACRC7D_10175 [Aeromonas popoffii]|uniref:hypothetical protein n=1 Tax=Aeromonas popoffii TaxID=70856 RepID=UPI003F3F2C16